MGLLNKMGRFDTSRHAYIMHGKRVDRITDRDGEDRKYFHGDRDNEKDHGWVPKNKDGIDKDGLDDDDEDDLTYTDH